MKIVYTKSDGKHHASLCKDNGEVLAVGSVFYEAYGKTRAEAKAGLQNLIYTQLKLFQAFHTQQLNLVTKS